MKKKINSAFKNKKIIIGLILAIIVSIISIVIINKLFTTNIEEIKDSVVLIEVFDEDKQLIASGSGFSAFKENWIVTNFHVIEGGRYISVTTDNGDSYEVNDIVIFNKKEDLAIIEIKGSLKPLKIGNGDKIKTKDKVTAIGSPMGEKNTVSEGIISNADEKNIIRITAPISHGSSGGVLLNKRNEVIGITSAGYDEAQNLNFAININVLNKIHNLIKKGKYDTIDENNYTDCVPNIVNYNTKNQLKIKNKCSFSSYNNYSADSMYSFYLATNQYEIFNSAMNKIGIKGLNINYKNMSKENQKKASQYYSALLEFEDCNTNSPTGCTIDNIDNWNNEQLVMELDIMHTYALAIFLVELDNYNSSDKFPLIDKLPLEIPKRVILNYIYGGLLPSDFVYSDADSVVSFIDEYDLSVEEKGKILNYLGYSVNGTDVRW